MKYPNSEKLALDDVSFTINPGQTVLIVGELTISTDARSKADNIQARMAVAKRLPSAFWLDCGTVQVELFSLMTGPYKTTGCKD